MKTKLINSTNHTIFETELNKAIEDIENKGYKIIDIKFSTDDKFWNVLIIYSTKD